MTEAWRETGQITLAFITAKKGNTVHSKMSISGSLAAHRRHKAISEQGSKVKGRSRNKVTVAITNEEEMRETTHA